MFRDGTYTVWFRTSRGQGTAIVHLAQGVISGGDSFFHYGGTYAIDGDRFTATLTTRRFADGPTTVLGFDDVELELTGLLKGTIARCTGTAAQAPGLLFEAMLFLGEDEPVAPPIAPSDMTPSNIARLPKGATGRSRSRNPFSPARPR